MSWLVADGRAGLTTLTSAALILVSSNALTEPAEALPIGAQPQLSFTCQFSNGPRVGQTQSYPDMSNLQPMPIGAPCTDSSGSTGVAIADPFAQPATPVQPVPISVPRSTAAAIAPLVQPAGPAKPTPASAPEGMTFTCGFKNGPRAGEAQSYAGVTGIQPIAIGSQCSDGQGSAGVTIPDRVVESAALVQPYPNVAPQEVSFTCGFKDGPRASQTQSYAGVTGMQPVPIGAQCTDGQGSAGVMIAEVTPGVGAITTAPPAGVIKDAAVGAAIGGLAGAFWADANNSGYVTGYTRDGLYYSGTPAGYDPATHAVLTGAITGAALGAAAGAVLPGLSIPADAAVGAAVGGLGNAVWVDRNNDGAVDGYVYNGRYYPGVTSAYAHSAAPPPPPPPPSLPSTFARTGERG